MSLCVFTNNAFSLVLFLLVSFLLFLNACIFAGGRGGGGLWGTCYSLFVNLFFLALARL